LIRDSETIATPGSTTRQRSSTAGSQRLLNTQRNIPTTCEMDEFFAGVEQQQQRLFIEKYAGFNSSIQEYAHSYACLT